MGLFNNAKLVGISGLKVGDQVVCILPTEHGEYIRRVEQITPAPGVLSGLRIIASKGLSATGEYDVGHAITGMAKNGVDAGLYWPVRYTLVLFDFDQVPSGWSTLMQAAPVRVKSHLIFDALAKGHFQTIPLHGNTLDDVVLKVGKIPLPGLPHYKARPFQQDLVLDRYERRLWLHGDHTWFDVSRFLPFLTQPPAGWQELAPAPG